MGSRKLDLSIACLVDEDIADRVARFVASGGLHPSGRMTAHDRARVKYDATMISALGALYREVHIVAAIAGTSKWTEAILRLAPDVVFNLAFSAHPLEASMAGALELLGIPYTGSGPLGIALSNDKVRSRHLLQSAGLHVPKFVELRPGSPTILGLTPPLIVKPVSLASSIGIHSYSIVETERQVAGLASRIWERLGVPAICEEFVVGREFRVALVEVGRGGVSVAGATEWHFGHAREGWGLRTELLRSSLRVQRAKKVNRTKVPRDDKLYAEFAVIGRRAMAALDLRGYATMDLRYRQERLTVIEVNSNPGIWPGGSTWGHPSFELTLRRIVNAAIRKARD